MSRLRPKVPEEKVSSEASPGRTHRGRPKEKDRQGKKDQKEVRKEGMGMPSVSNHLPKAQLHQKTHAQIAPVGKNCRRGKYGFQKNRCCRHRVYG